MKDIFNKALAFIEEDYSAAEPIAKGFYEKNQLAAIAIFLAVFLVLIFWFKMLRHAFKKELVWKKSWTFFIFILGPLGALAYYFGRKKALERKEYRKQEVEMSFFKPMSKRLKE